MPVSSRGPRRCRSWWCHTCSSTPSTRTPAKRAGSSDAACRHGLMWDHTVFHVVPNWRARPQVVAPSKRSCRIAQRIARTPKRALGAHRVVLLSESRDLAGVFAAYPASLKPPDPHRDPGPGRVNHLHHHAPMTLCDHPTPRAASKAITGLYVEHQSIWGASHAHQMETLQTDEQITPITTIKRRRAAAGRVRHCRGPLTTAGVEVRSSSRTSTSTRNPQPTPTHPHSTQKSRIWFRAGRSK